MSRLIVILSAAKDLRDLRDPSLRSGWQIGFPQQKLIWPRPGANLAEATILLRAHRQQAAFDRFLFIGPGSALPRPSRVPRSSPYPARSKAVPPNTACADWPGNGLATGAAGGVFAGVALISGVLSTSKSRPNGPRVLRTVGPLGRQYRFGRVNLPRALSWARRTVPLRGSESVAKKSCRAPGRLRPMPPLGGSASCFYTAWFGPRHRLYCYKAMTRIAILGATGYTALELIKILLRHPEAEIVAVTSRQEGQPHIAMIHPSLTGRLDLRLEDLSPAEVAARADCVFSCLPHGASAAVVPALLGRRPPRGRFQCRLPAQRCRGLRPVVRPEACRPRPAGQGRLRTARTVPKQTFLRPNWWPIRAAIPRRPFWRWRRC